MIIQQFDENGNEFWLARDLQYILNYSEWRNFLKVIEKAKTACVNSGIDLQNHFVDVNKMDSIGSGTRRQVEDMVLSRYACYLITQNADARKKVVALGQTYFAIQTRKQEVLEEEIAQLSEDEKRLTLRDNVKASNKNLFATAQDHGVRNFGKFNNRGYQGLYNGEIVATIKKRKHLKKNNDILDHMGSTELAANWFRITQTDEKLKKDKIYDENESCETHYQVGKSVRDTMINISGIAPEKLPTPKKSIKKLESEKRLALRNKNK